jgi:predicted nucleic acid-binding protein
MGPFKRIYLDTNILIELAEIKGEQQSLLYEIADMRTADGKPFVCTSELTLAELLVRPYRQQNDELIELYNGWIMQGSDWLEVGPVTRDVLWHAALVRQYYPNVKLPDAIHLATAILFGCSHFLTGDKRIPNEIKITNLRWGISKIFPNLKLIKLLPEVLQWILSDRA